MRASDALVEALAELGVTHAFGILGGAVAPLYDALARSRIKLIHCRHETGAAFAATEAYFANGRPAAVVVTTGPGITNALTGLAAARWEGAKLILLAPTTSAPHRGRWAFQETSPYTMPGFFTRNSWFHFGAAMESVEELDEVVCRLARGIAQPGGFVAGIGVPGVLQSAPARRTNPRLHLSAPPAAADPRVVEACARLLSESRFAIWVGFGARQASAQVRALAERAHAPVICTPRGKGVFPEHHPLFCGVTGMGGALDVRARLGAHQPQRMLVLGTRLGEFSSYWDPDLVPPGGLVHVDIDPEVPGAAYPAVSTYGVVAEIGGFLDALLSQLPGHDEPPPPNADHPHTPRLQARPGLVRPQMLMRAVQLEIVDSTDAMVLSDSGNVFAWATHELSFASPGRYRVGLGFGSMGNASTGVIGAALARPGKAVALVGDGAMLMGNELSTAVAYQAPAVWVVLNNGCYGMTRQGMRAVGFEPAETGIPPTDFAMMAHSMGAQGVRVTAESDLEPALRDAIRARGPFVVDVLIDPEVPAPVGLRNKNLLEQWSSQKGE